MFDLCSIQIFTAQELLSLYPWNRKTSKSCIRPLEYLPTIWELYHSESPTLTPYPWLSHLNPELTKTWISRLFRFWPRRCVVYDSWDLHTMVLYLSLKFASEWQERIQACEAVGSFNQHSLISKIQRSTKTKVEKLDSLPFQTTSPKGLDFPRSEFWYFPRVFLASSGMNLFQT